MPIQSYCCVKCGEKFERILNRDEYDKAAPACCPECDGLAETELPLPARRNPAYGIQK
jgi:putative FmdB family regulatory protein